MGGDSHPPRRRCRLPRAGTRAGGSSGGGRSSGGAAGGRRGGGEARPRGAGRRSGGAPGRDAAASSQAALCPPAGPPPPARPGAALPPIPRVDVWMYAFIYRHPPSTPTRTCPPPRRASEGPLHVIAAATFLHSPNSGPASGTSAAPPPPGPGEGKRGETHNFSLKKNNNKKL